MIFSNIKFLDLDQPAMEEFIQHYAQNYSSLKKALKFKETFLKSSQNYYAKP